MRKAEINRKTRETDIHCSLVMDGKGTADIDTKIGFFDHMLTAFSAHSGISLTLHCDGDIHVDGHHTVEDCGIVLGMALNTALGNKSGIARYGSFYIPMDEALGFCSLDISNRPYLVFHADFTNPQVGNYDCCLTEEFFRALAVNAGITLHLESRYGKNDHHIIEALFKAFGHALKAAIVETGTMLSTKGVL